MPPVRVIMYRDEQGRVPVAELVAQAEKPDRYVIRRRIGELAVQGYELQRPATETVGDGLYALRAHGYRIFYFFHERTAVVLCCGYLKKDKRLLNREIQRAKRMREVFLTDPTEHSVFIPEPGVER